MEEEGGFVKNENNWVFQIETFNTNRVQYFLIYRKTKHLGKSQLLEPVGGHMVSIVRY